MSEANERTIRTYNDDIQAYIDGTPQVTTRNQKKWLDGAFANIKKDASILEIGSAFGRDWRYLTEQGFTIDATDGTPNFVEYLQQQGIDARYLDIIRDMPKKHYDAVLASAVFLHFNEDDFNKAATNVRNVLHANGKFIFSVKQGDGEQWTTTKMGAERYFKYWRRDTLEASLGALGFVMNGGETFEDDKWIYAVAQKGATNESQH